jgi:hypothetical protein
MALLPKIMNVSGWLFVTDDSCIFSVMPSLIELKLGSDLRVESQISLKDLV